jgi:peptide/nickel transport system permease protein
MKVTGAIAIVRIPIYARLVRGSVLSIKEKEYIEACRALGVRDPWILSATSCRTAWRHHRDHHARDRHLDHRRGHPVVPGARHPAPTPSWGWDLKANVAFIQSNPWLSLFPGLAIFVTVLGFNLFGDGLRDALDPRLK